MFTTNSRCLFTSVLRMKLLPRKTLNSIHSGSIFSLNLMKSSNNVNISIKRKAANRTVMIRRFSTSNQENTANSADVNPGNDKNKSRPKPDLTAIFELDDGTKLTGKACHGDNLLDVVLNNELPIEGFGACEGTLACSTCHVILSQEDFDRLSNPITDEEMDMLDLAYGLTETSRLGCRVYMTKDFDGIKVKVPAGVNDVRLR